MIGDYPVDVERCIAASVPCVSCLTITSMNSETHTLVMKRSTRSGGT